MERRTRFAFLVIFFVLAAHPTLAQSRPTVPELELMTASELLAEARTTCLTLRGAEAKEGFDNGMVDKKMATNPGDPSIDRWMKLTSEAKKQKDEQLAGLRAIRLVLRKKGAGKGNADIQMLIDADAQRVADWCPKPPE